MKLIFSDFDGTLTEKRELTPVFFSILNHIKENNQELIIVSGRSVSWGHFLLTHFPLQAVIMEGGGVILTQDENGLITEHLMLPTEEINKLEKVTNDLKRLHPDLPLTEDSFGRKTDRAAEFHYMNDEQIARLYQFLDGEGVNHSSSNVHINFWCGEVSKSKASKFFLEKFRPHLTLKDCLFFGDAPNDESMFKFFPHTVGVSNISSYLEQISHHPKVILKGEENRGPRGVYNYLKGLSSTPL